MTYEKNDRLSSLPREIQILIISFLPTKFAVGTAILSRSYRHLWTHINALRFTITDFPEQKLMAILFIIIRRVLWRHVNAIELTINAHRNTRDHSSLTSLIHDIVYTGTNIKELKVCFENFGESTIPLPSCILEKRSLEGLEVYSPHGISLGNVQAHKYPNLRKLVITIIEFDLDNLEDLVNSCPLLEFLRVNVEMMTKFKGSIKLNAQNLKCLIVNLIGKEYSFDKSKIMLDTPELLYFEVHSPSMVKFCFLKTPSGLFKAKLFMGDGHQGLHLYSKHLMSVINPIFRVKTLKLSGDLLLALVNLNVKVEIFHNLSHLEMGLSCSLSWHAVKYFLAKCRNVECLVLKRTGKANLDAIYWTEFDFLPRCLHNKIQRIELRGFIGNVSDLLLLSYIFRVTKELKMFYITIEKEDAFDNEEVIRKCLVRHHLNKLSKEQPTCEINFCDKFGYRNGQELWRT